MMNRALITILGFGMGTVIGILVGMYESAQMDSFDQTIQEFQPTPPAGSTHQTVDSGQGGEERSTRILDEPPRPLPVGGRILRDETWGGEILVTDHVDIPQGVRLTIKPGTVVRFKHYRGYKEPRRLGIEVRGALIAVGTPKDQIRFTSDAPDPANGDWGMMRFVDDANRSELRYAIVEFAQQGLNLWNSSATISRSIVRWSNWEGIYLESYSKPVIEYNLIYQNGYNGIAMEQFNDAVIRFNHVWGSGTNGIHVDASRALVEGNLIERNENGLSVDDSGAILSSGNIIRDHRGAGISCGEGANKVVSKGDSLSGNRFVGGCPGSAIVDAVAQGADIRLQGKESKVPPFDFSDLRPFDLGYTPSDPKDRYPYVYPDDETRKIVRKIGRGLGLTWSIAWDGEAVWTATLWGDVYKLDPETGAILKNFTLPLEQAWGMAFDGRHLWITDFATKKTHEVDPEAGRIISSFNNPDQGAGAKGLAWDGEFLYIMRWGSSLIEKVDRQGKLLESIPLEAGGGGGLAFDGEHFWVPGCHGICKYRKDGRHVGEIYAASEGTWDLAWDPKHGWLWAAQRTNENWDDEKIFALDVLDDSMKS